MATKNTFLVMLIVTSFYNESIAEPSDSIIMLSNPYSASSPFCKPNSTSYSRSNDTINASKSRFNYIQVKTKNIVAKANAEVGVIPYDDGMGFIANVSIGTPPVVQFLVMDTGSSFTWTQCTTCEPCKLQKGPMFNPDSSTSFKKIKCSDPRCDLAPMKMCSQYGQCQYGEEYADDSSTNGIVVTETFTFKKSISSDIVMGCGLVNIDTSDNQTSGILGLGPDEASLSKQLGLKFSYCIGTEYNRDPEYHFLIIGKDAIMMGNPSPMIIENGCYYLTLEGIMIGNESLNIDPAVFKLNADGTGGVLIDSGTFLTYLTKPAYEMVVNEVVRLLPNLTTEVREDHNNMTVFNGWLPDLINFPQVIFQFANGQNLTLNLPSLFIMISYNSFYMTIVESDTDMSLIGAYAQQNYNVGYDVPAKNIYFSSTTDCRTL